MNKTNKIVLKKIFHGCVCMENVATFSRRIQVRSRAVLTIGLGGTEAPGPEQGWCQVGWKGRERGPNCRRKRAFY